MCCANPKGRTPECARTRTHPHAEGQGPDLQPGSAPHNTLLWGLGCWSSCSGLGQEPGKGRENQTRSLYPPSQALHPHGNGGGCQGGVFTLSSPALPKGWLSIRNRVPNILTVGIGNTGYFETGAEQL